VSSMSITIASDDTREQRVTDTTTTGLDLFGNDRRIVAVRVNGELRDLHLPLSADDVVEPVKIDSPDGLNILRHSTAHVAAQAVQSRHPDAKLGIGPPITDGFYYDFDIAHPFTPEDLRELERLMTKIIKERQRFRRRPVSDQQARDELASEPYKLELIADKASASGSEIGQSDGSGDAAAVEVGAGELTIYDNLRRDDSVVWKDLCRGPHVPHTGYIPAFALTRNSAAYWRGDQQNAQLQRLYGTAWPSREELRAHQTRLEEAAKRDHRKLGIELDLFSFPEEIGSGLSVFHPKGGLVRKIMEDYSRQRHVEAGYDFVNTPHISKAELFDISGHLGFYAETMYPPMHVDEERHADGSVKRQGQDYYLKPMNCPMHCLIFRSRGRSYRELPLRLFEFGSVYRYERSGVVHGLTRVRGMTQDDAHIFCTIDQMQDELISLLRFVLDLLGDYGLEDFYLELSTRDPEKSIGSDEDWERATDALSQAAERGSLLRAQDLGPGSGRDRSKLADVHDPGGPDVAGPIRPGDHGSRRQQAAAGDDPPCAVRICRTVHRGPGRALCRCIPPVAGAGPGSRRPGRRRVRQLPPRGGRSATKRRRASRGGHLRRPDAEEDPARREGEGAFRVDCRGRGRGRRCGLVPLSRSQPEERRTGPGRPRRDHRSDRLPAPGLMSGTKTTRRFHGV
jgi:threonyl-tRNA synthetase